MPIEWTPAQLQAIEARGGSLLVSAAAGSGKTAVLVERVLRLLTDPIAPCGADELLVVTFTRAAAAQMREGIAASLEERLRAQPSNTALLRQRELLPLAQICTIDSFCLSLVKEHAPALGLPQAPRLLDESERVLLRAEAAEAALEAAYLADEAAFRQLGLLLEVSGDDRRLQKLLQRAADMALAQPAPAAWLAALPDAYSRALPPEQTLWGRIQLEEALERLSLYASLASQSLAGLAADPSLYDRYAPALQADLALVTRLEQAVRLGDWDALRTQLNSISFEDFSRKPKGCDEALAGQCQARRRRFKDELKKCPKLFCVSAGEHLEDMAALAPVAAAFIALVRDFIERCRAEKARRGAADFNDVLHWALDLLVTPSGERTPLALDIGAGLREILVDEYQDVNAAQGLLFDALSRDGKNLFLVGDVKQSIYRFRQASPELFLQKRAGPSLVLGKNFRSRPGVTDAVNFTFRQLMSARAAEIEYTPEEELVCRGDFTPCASPDTELHLLSFDPAQEDGLAAEARYIARWIAGEIAKGRRARDFCILLRSDHKPGMAYAQALQEAGVTACALETESLFRSCEIQILLSLLRVVDNPAQDVPLAAVLLSPVVGFSPDALALLRANHREAASLYQCVRTSMETGDPQCAAFLARLASWRQMAAVSSVGDLTRWLLEDTALLAVAGAMPQPARRRANLHRLMDYALSFGARQGTLSGFLRYMARVEADETLVAAATVSETADAVRVMSIHRAKGLEFPVCILAQCARKFNLMDAQQDHLLLHAQAGLGLRRPEEETRRRLSTLPHAALQTAIRRGALSEELRLLYVAMTRAKERLVLLCSARDPAKKLRGLAAGLTLGRERLEPAQVQGAGSFADWLLSAFLRHPDAHVLRELAGLPADVILPAKEPMRFYVPSAAPDAQSPEQPQHPIAPPAPTGALRAFVRARLAYRYPRETLSRLAAKRAVSELTERAAQEAFAFSSRPAFVRAGGVTAAQRGTAMHAFLQYADYPAAARGLDAEIARLCEHGYLTPKDAAALERDKLARFFAGPFAARMLASGNLLREKKFTLRVPAAELTAEDPLVRPEDVEGEYVVVQGIIDCAFEEDGALVLLDYKTDRVEDLEVLRGRYGGQLSYYRRAMRECFGMEVSEALIYSFWLGDFITI
ncbi:MAG: UvrD-helicase domain-containing protein [Oscillospiraceae bacterium]|nr:UvrD-helicase domain-containing protein [Oscillospiraceae bacterium]